MTPSSPRRSHATGAFDFMHDYPIWAWAGFLVFIAAMLALDLGVFHRKPETISLRKAIYWCVVWVSLALAFNLFVALWHGKEAGLQFLTGYVVELSLSVDNVFVFILLFSYFRVPSAYHHRVLFWGIIGAVMMRAVFIVTGIAILQQFHFVIYLFGAFLVFTGIRMAIPHDDEIDPERNPVLRIFRRLFPVASGYDGARFLTRREGGLKATPLLVVLVAVETTDLVFAVDSIPAILAITQNAFIVFTSNIFAVLGLRSFYFALSGIMQLFRFLSYGLAVVLTFIGIKMLISGFYEIPIEYSLGIIGLALGTAVALSLTIPKKPDGPSTGKSNSGPLSL